MNFGSAIDAVALAEGENHVRLAAWFRYAAPRHPPITIVVPPRSGLQPDPPIRAKNR